MTLLIPLLLASLASGSDFLPDQQERAEIAQLACLAPHRVALGDIAASKRDGLDGLVSYSAIVRCQPRGRIDGFRTRYRTQCEKISAQWQCAPAVFALVIPLAARTVDLVIEGRISASRAVAMLRYAASVRHFGVEDTSGWVQDVCTLSALDASSWQLVCGAAQFQIAEDCIRNRCRLRLFLAEKLVVSSTLRGPARIEQGCDFELA
jgi:hypothetical protein